MVGEEKVARLILKVPQSSNEHALGTARLGWGVGALVTAPVTACGSVHRYRVLTRASPAALRCAFGTMWIRR